MIGTLQRLIKSWFLSSPAQYSELAGKISVLAITNGEGDRAALSRFSIRGQWDLTFTNTCEDALGLLIGHRATVIVLDRDLPGCDWREALKTVSDFRPDCPIILASSVCDEYLWEEVVHNGGYDVLGKPLQEEHAVRAVNLAWSYSKTGSPEKKAGKIYGHR